MDLKNLMQAEDGRSLGLEPKAVRLEEIKEPAGTGDCFAGSLDHAGEEKSKPLLPVASESDVLKKLVIGISVAFEMKGKIKQWLAEHPFCTEDESDEETPETAIAIEKRVDRLKLDVSERGLEQRTGGDGVVMKKFLMCHLQQLK